MNPFWEVFSMVCLKSLLQSSPHLDSSLKGEEDSHRCPPDCHSFLVPSCLPPSPCVYLSFLFRVPKLILRFKTAEKQK